MYDRTVLPNGLRVLSSTMPHTRSVSVGIFVGAGSRYEDDAIAGGSHYLEHVLFKGTEKRPEPQLIAGAIEGVGGIMHKRNASGSQGFGASLDFFGRFSAIRKAREKKFQSRPVRSFPQGRTQQVKGLLPAEEAAIHSMLAGLLKIHRVLTPMPVF